MEGDVTHSNHNFGPETIIHPLLFKVGGPCFLEGELSPHLPTCSLTAHSLPGFCQVHLSQVSLGRKQSTGPQRRH